MAPFSPTRPRHPIRVVLSSDALLPFLSVRKAAALAIAQLGIGAFFIAGVTGTALGASAAWFVLSATLLAAFVRAIDVESWALEMGIPNGLMRRGWTRDSMKIGDVVTVTGSRAKDGSTKGNARSVVLSTGKRLFAGSSQDNAEAN